MQCSSCGATLQPGRTKCPSCGVPVTIDTSDSSPYEEHVGSVPYIPYTPLKEREAAPASPASPAAPAAQEGSRSSDLLAGAQPQQANAQATANVANLTPQELYTRITSGKPAISDPLDSINHSLFVSRSNSASSCGFTGGTYHASASPHFTIYCFAPIGVSNFAFQAQMTIIKGDAGGLVFRLNSDTSSLNSYLFLIDRLGGYSLVALQNTNNARQLVNGVNPAIKVGLNQSNLLTVLALGSNLFVYVNKQYITRVGDNTFSSGIVGVFATGANATDVAFSNAQIWRL